MSTNKIIFKFFYNYFFYFLIDIIDNSIRLYLYIVFKPIYLLYTIPTRFLDVRELK